MGEEAGAMNMQKRANIYLRSAGLIIAATFALGAPQTRANDGFYELASGGLVLSQADGIAIDYEELRISFNKVSVTYKIKNLDNAAKQAVIGFPLPHPQSLDDESDGPGAEGLVEMLATFETRVDGKDVSPEGTDIAVVLFPPIYAADVPIADRTASTLDITGLLRDAGLPLDAENLDLSQLDDETFSAMIRQSLPDDYRDQFPGWWEVRQIPYWTQTFEANAAIAVSHTYEPKPGSVIGSAYDVKSGELQLTDENVSYEAENTKFEIERLRENWRAGNPGLEVSCSIHDEEIAEVVEGGIRKLLAQRIAEGVIDTSADDYLGTEYTHMTYVLTTANSWTGPIQDFNLVVDGQGLPLVFCIPGEIRLTDPDRFVYEVNISNFTPTVDLEIVRPF